MTNVVFNSYDFNIRKKDSAEEIFDVVRKKWILITAEEWVRQHILHFLIQKDYPIQKIAVERSFKVNGLTKRFDIVVYNNDFEPLLLIECKKPEVPINEKTAHQAIAYQQSLKCKYWWLSNGEQNYFFKLSLSPQLVIEIPNYKDLL